MVSIEIKFLILLRIPQKKNYYCTKQEPGYFSMHNNKRKNNRNCIIDANSIKMFAKHYNAYIGNVREAISSNKRKVCYWNRPKNMTKERERIMKPLFLWHSN